jgi:signal peptidase I
MARWVEGVESATKTFLLWRKRRKFIKKQKQSKKHWLLDWIEAFLWAALVVLFINQYFFQAYQIPSGSMKNTLLIKDRIFVNKYIYGPEAAPGLGKLPGMENPKRGEVIIFENPTYISRGTVFDILQRVIYMVTLSLVDIDKDKEGNPRPHFLIKRAVGVGGDRIRFSRGEVEFKLPDSSAWEKERNIERLGVPAYEIRRIIQQDQYSRIEQAGKAEAYLSAQLPLSDEMRQAAEGSSYVSADTLEWNKHRYKALYSIYPHEKKYESEWRRRKTGWYIPDGWIFPLGDNRDNSRDARYFGPVNTENVLGKAMFIYLPLHRIGKIE